MKKKQLGKGIRALLSNIDEKDSETRDKIVRELSDKIAMVPPENIEVNPFQPRKEFSASELEELTDSIKMHGLIQPITVRRLNEHTFQIISGERRWRASREAGLREIPAYIRLANDQAMLEMALIENIQRQDLNPIEIAISLGRLLDECQLTHEALSDRVSKSRSAVTNYLRLLKLPPAVQDAVRNYKISMGHARALVGIKNPAAQLSLLNKIQADALSVRATENLIRKLSEEKTPPKPTATQPKKTKSKQVDSLEDRMLQKFGAKTTIEERESGDGKIVIHFEDRDHLNQLLEYFDVI